MNNKCPNCGAAYSITAQHVGRTFSCQRCGTPMVVHADGLHTAQSPVAAGAVGDQIQPQSAAQALPPAPPPRGQVSPPDSSFGELVERPQPRRRVREGNAFVDFLLFRRMIAPWVIMGLFWVGIMLAILWGIIYIISGLVMLANKDIGPLGLVFMFLGVLVIIIGPFVVRLYAEFIIVVFRISETLTDILTELRHERD
jgi:ribosomal protein S27AE